MALEQEVASIAAFCIAAAGDPKPYYCSVPESIRFPAIYFPRPEILTRGETFRTWAAEYALIINIICENTEDAHDRALSVVSAIRRARNLIPILEQDGTDSGEGIRTRDPSIKTIDSGVVQLTVEWTSRRPYADAEAAGDKMMRHRVHYNG